LAELVVNEDIIMEDAEILSYVIKDPLELNLSYIPFITDGGLFIPTQKAYGLGDKVMVDLLLPGKQDALRIDGKIVWITPKNALHHVLAGIGIQFMGSNTKVIRNQIEANLDMTMEVGGYTYGITEKTKRDK
jgi:type IV pilus assembly protein PilZ